jgi:flagellar basal-body rod modification protein FlgD
MIQDIVNSSSNSATAGEVAKAPKRDLGQEDFLRLMVAQVKNQDPMQPQENGEFLSQLAQFSTNDGVNKMQKSLEQLATSLQSNQALQASALVGRKVLVNSDTLTLDATGEAKAAMDLPLGVNNLSASVYTTSGELVKTIPLGQPAPGFFQFAWDGNGQDGKRMASGYYRMDVRGMSNGREVHLKPLATANVDSVSLGQNGEGLKLNVAGVGPVTLDQVRQISI